MNIFEDIEKKGMKKYIKHIKDSHESTMSDIMRRWATLAQK